MIYLRPLHCKEHGLSATNGKCRLCLASSGAGKGTAHLEARGTAGLSAPTPVPAPDGVRK